MQELIAEERFTPDAIQEKQLDLIKNPPAPGFLELFKYTWKGTK